MKEHGTVQPSIVMLRIDLLRPSLVTVIPVSALLLV